MTITRKIKDFQIKPRNIPWVLLGISLLTYGIMIHQLGFYWDDWPTLFLTSAATTPSQIHLFPFRPLHVYLDIWTLRLLGYNPLSWHLLMLMIRYLGSLFFWMFLETLWPRRQTRNAWAAIFFLVYPSFLHQSMSVIYRQHFTTAMLYLLSMYLMVRAYNAMQEGNRSSFWIFYIFSILSGITHLFIMEYFSAMELLRPIVIFMLILRDRPKARDAIRKLLVFWLPYLVYLIGFTYWRIQLASSNLGDPNQTILFDAFKSAPLKALVIFIQNAFLDLRYMLAGSWLDIFSIDLVDISSPVSIGILVIIAISITGLYLLFSRFSNDAGDQKQNRGELEALILGAAGLVLGLVPAWLIGRNVFEGRHDTRFSIPALAGVSLLVVSILLYLIPDKKRSVAVLAFLAACAIGNQIHMTNTFRWDWERQTRAYWQLHWRAPEIEPKTAFLVNKSLTSYATTYPVAHAVNFMYSYDDLSMVPNYWWFEIYESNLYTHTDELLQGGWIDTEEVNIQIKMRGKDSLVFFLPGANEPTKCLWLLTDLDTGNSDIPVELRAFAPLTNLSRIKQDSDSTLPLDIFGQEPAPSWCTYYQKAQLADQFEEWDTVIELFETAKAQGMRSSFGHEYIPFISAFIALNKWDQAANLSINAFKLSRSSLPEICTIWQRANPLEISSEYQSAIQEVNITLGCTTEN